LGDFWEPTGPGASVRAVFSAEGVPLVRWASGNFDFFRDFFTFLMRFLPVFGAYFALFPSMPCAYLYVHNFPRTRISRFGRENLAFDKETVEATRPLDPTRAALRFSKGGKPETGKKGGASGRRRTAKRRSRPEVSSLKPPARGSAGGEISLRGLDTPRGDAGRPRGPRVRQTARSGDLAASSLPLKRVPGNPHAVRVPRQRTQSLGLWVAQGDKRLDRSWERETIKDQRPTAVVGRVIWEISVEIAAGPPAEASK